MHVVVEQEQFIRAAVPAAVGTEHLVILPHVRAIAEPRGGQVTAVLQARGFHEGGVHVHVHVVVEHEQLRPGIIAPVQALDHLAVFVAHGGAVLENGHGVLCVVIQPAGAEGVFVSVFQLHQVAAETRQVFLHHILEGFTAQLGIPLDNADVARGVNDAGIHVPKGRIAEQIGVVMEKAGRPHHLSERLPVHFQQLGAFGAEQLHFLPGVLPGKGDCRQGEQQ